MDSMGFDPKGGDPTRITNGKGGVYRTDVGPDFYESWDNLSIARDLALASVRYQPDQIDFFELGNEPNNYNASRWNGSTQAYVEQWKNWTAEIDQAVNAVEVKKMPTNKWWVSSSTTDKTTLNIRPIDLIPAGINSKHQVAEYSIHSYAFSTCDSNRTALATIPNLLNHTALAAYADNEIGPSAKAALAAGTPWIIGEFREDGRIQHLCPGPLDDRHSAHLRRASDQDNKPPADGSPLYSSYSFVYTRNSTGRGAARVLPGYYGLLFIAEALAGAGTQVRALSPPHGVSSDGFSAYGLYVDNKISKVAIINMMPYINTSTSDNTITIRTGVHKGSVKRLTAEHVTEEDAARVTWAGQAYNKVQASGKETIETLGRDGEVRVRGSEAVLISVSH